MSASFSNGLSPSSILPTLSPALILQCCVLQLVSSLLLLPFFFLSVSASCCAQASHFFCMKCASDKNRLNLKLFILSAIQDIGIQLRTMMRRRALLEPGTLWAGMQGCEQPGMTVPQGSYSWYLCLLLAASLLSVFHSSIIVEMDRIFYLDHLEST